MRVTAGRWRGFRAPHFPPSALEAALRLHDQASGDAVLKNDHRSRVTAALADDFAVVVKEVRKAGARRRLADAFRGSPAKRSWDAARGLLAREIGVATPLAWVERRALGVPVRSLGISEDLRPTPTAPDYASRGEEASTAALQALSDLVIALHANGVVHGDLRAQHVHLVADGGNLRPTLIDIEGVRFTRGLSDEQRIDALAELNASWPDALSDADARREAFARYADALPFRKGGSGRSSTDFALREVARRSLARGHLWRARGCAAATAGR